MKKFNIFEYDLNNIGSQFDLVTDPNSNITYRVKLSLTGDTISVTDLSGELFCFNDAPYLKRVHILYESNDQYCAACGYRKPIHGAINSRLLCEKHYNNEAALIKMSIRDFLFKVDTIEEYKLLNENYCAYVHNEHDLKFPCLVVLHKEVDHQYDQETYTMYVVNSDMNIVK